MKEIKRTFKNPNGGKPIVIMARVHEEIFLDNEVSNIARKILHKQMKKECDRIIYKNKSKDDRMLHDIKQIRKIKCPKCLSAKESVERIEYVSSGISFGGDKRVIVCKCLECKNEFELDRLISFKRLKENSIINRYKK